jgi:hypothetical protein
MNRNVSRAEQKRKDHPVQASSRIIIEAPARTVWRILTDLAHWERWNPDVTDVSVEGPVAAGMTFRWRAGTARITSTIQEVQPDRMIRWTGRTMGVRADHLWRIEPQDGRTAVETVESWRGVFPRLFPGKMRRVLQQSLDKGLRSLKIEAEKRAQDDHEADQRPSS